MTKSRERSSECRVGDGTGASGWGRRGGSGAPLAAFTILELLFAVTLLALLIGGLFWSLASIRRASQSVATQASLQQAGRKAMVRFLRELQEGMEVVSPRPGATLAYAVVRDKVSIVRWYVQHPRGKPADGLFELWRYLGDPTLPKGRKEELLLSNVRRLTFTSSSEGALQVNIVLVDQGQEYAMLTTIRLRNLPSAEALW